MFLKILSGILDFLDTNRFLGMVTICVGLFAFRVYGIQKEDEKKNAAIIVLMEIRNAENSIKTMREKKLIAGYSLSVLPVSSWSKFSHLFVRDLDADELNSLNDFYRNCSLVEGLLRKLDDAHDMYMQEKWKVVLPRLLELSEKYKDKTPEENFKNDSDYWKERTALQSTYSADKTVPMADQVLNIIIKTVTTMQLMTDSSVVQKLRKMVGIKNDF